MQGRFLAQKTQLWRNSVSFAANRLANSHFCMKRFQAFLPRRLTPLPSLWSVSHLLRALDTFRVLGIELVTLSESLDTATPAGRMVFTVLGAVAELERSLIAERV